VDGEDGLVYADERIEEVGAGGGGGLEDLVGLGCICLCFCIAALLEPFLDLELWVPTWEVRPRSERSARTSLLTLNFTGLDPNENRRHHSVQGSAGGLIFVKQVAREEDEITARGRGGE